MEATESWATSALESFIAVLKFRRSKLPHSLVYTVQRLRQQFPLKRRHVRQITHGITSQNTVVFTVINYRKFKVFTPVISLATALETI